jgi:2-polyprenyl-3-methyl-5-hydroxy-6-metoxy-1,4-benzoquinol methylase
MLSFIPPTARRILDVGCAEGKFGALLKERLDAEVWGIEYEPAAAEKARKRLDHVLTGDALALIETLEEEKFDCITVLDVLEHLPDPFTLLKSVKRIFNKDGFLVLSVPNVLYISNLYRLLVEKDWHYIDHGILDKTHLRFFTKKSLIRTLNSHGYQIKVFEGISPVRGILFPLFNFATLGHFSDSRYLQFACVARPL